MFLKLYEEKISREYCRFSDFGFYAVNVFETDNHCNKQTKIQVALADLVYLLQIHPSRRWGVVMDEKKQEMSQRGVGALDENVASQRDDFRGEWILTQGRRFERYV